MFLVSLTAGSVSAKKLPSGDVISENKYTPIQMPNKLQTVQLTYTPIQLPKVPQIMSAAWDPSNRDEIHSQMVTAAFKSLKDPRVQ